MSSWLALAAVLAGLPSALAGSLRCEEARPPVEVWDGQGRTSACVSADGRWNGPAEHRRPDGSLRARGEHRDGAREGRWRFVAPDGSLQRWGHYEAGRPVGDWFTLDPTGAIVATVRWGAVVPDPRPSRPHSDLRVSWEARLPGAPRQMEVLGKTALIEVADALLAVALETGAREWTVPLREALRPGFVVGAGRLGAVTASGELVVVEPRDGAVHWIRTPLGVRDVLALTDEVAVVREGASRVEALDVATGRSLWRTKKAYPEVAPVEVAGLAVLARHAGVQARDLETGASVWLSRTPHRVRALAVDYAGEAVYVLDSAGGLSRLEAATGVVAWRVQVLGPVAAGATVQLRGDAGAVVLKTGQQLVAVSPEGTVFPRAPLPRDAAFEGDRLGTQVCFSTRTGTLDCGEADASPEDRWRVALSPLAVAPLMVPEQVLAALASGSLVAIDPSRAATAGGPLPSDSRLVDPAVRVVVWPGSGEGRGTEATAPLVEQDVANPEPACRTWRGVLDLHALTPAEAPPSVSVVAGARPPPRLREAFASTVLLDVPGLQLEESSLDAPAVVDADRWAVTDAQQDAELRYWVAWRPALKTLAATGGDPEVAASVERLLQCDGPPARFDGLAVIADDGIERQVAGRLSVAPLPHRLDGEPGCLLELGVSGEAVGTFAVPDRPGWVELLFRLEGVPSMDLGLPAVGAAGVPAQAAAQGLAMDGLAPGADRREEVHWNGPVSLQLVPSDWGTDLLVVAADGSVVAQVAADGLQYGLVGEGPSGEVVPVVDWTRHLSLEGVQPVDRTQERFWPVWTASWCDPQAEAGGPDDTGAAPPLQEAATEG